QGLTRFATFLWVGPLPAPQCGPVPAARWRCPRTLLVRCLPLVLMDRHLLNDDRRLRTALAFVIHDHGALSYSTQHVHPGDHFSEDGVVAVQERRLVQRDVEPRRRAVRLLAAAGPDRALLVAHLVARRQLRLQPVADAPGAGRAVAQRAAGL